MFNKRLKRKVLSIAICLGLITMVGCSSAENKDDDENLIETNLSIDTYGTNVKYNKVPETIVSLNSHTTENLLALGLGSKIVGTAYNNSEISDQYDEEFSKLNVLAEKYPSMEVLLGVNPDFVYGRNSAFGEKGVASVQDMVDNGIMPYVSKGTYTVGTTMEDVYEDFYNLGKIFKIEDKANKLVDGMKEKIALVKDKTSKIENKATVFVYDSGDEQAYTAGKSLQSHLIHLAGGKNVFEDELEKTWENVNWEKIVEKNPDYIMINDYGDKSADEKIEFLKTHPALQGLNAIKNDKFIVLKLSTVFEGVQNADAVEYISQGLYPELY